MVRIYDRQTLSWDQALLDLAVESGDATYFEKADVYVVKTATGSFAVRRHQVVDSGPQPEVIVDDHEDGPDPDEAYERHLETRYHDEIAAEEAQERANGALDYWEAKTQAEDDLLAKFL